MKDTTKKKCRALLEKLGILRPTGWVWSYLCLASSQMIFKEISYRIFGTPDEIPLPPNRLIYLVTGERWSVDFVDTGKAQMNQMMTMLNENGINVAELDCILDFGCGCGRLFRHLSVLRQDGKPKLYGADYNSEHIDWCKSNLPWAEFNTNGLWPPLKFKDNSFDLIFARSVFTHLHEDLQAAWTNELHRVLKPRGLLYVSTQGEIKIGELNDGDREEFRDGKLIIKNSSCSGMNRCVAYESRDFVVKELLAKFTLVDFIPGTEDRRLGQDVYLARKV